MLVKIDAVRSSMGETLRGRKKLDSVLLYKLHRLVPGRPAFLFNPFRVGVSAGGYMPGVSRSVIQIQALRAWGHGGHGGMEAWRHGGGESGEAVSRRFSQILSADFRRRLIVDGENSAKICFSSAKICEKKEGCFIKTVGYESRSLIGSSNLAFQLWPLSQLCYCQFCNK
jgi:hypothetical protein